MRDGESQNGEEKDCCLRWTQSNEGRFAGPSRTVQAREWKCTKVLSQLVDTSQGRACLQRGALRTDSEKQIPSVYKTM